MTLLRFRVANHKSIRDEQTLSLVAVPRRGEPKPRATEIPPTVRVAGIYGANASGKSNILDALRYMQHCIVSSQTQWRPDGGIPRQPFKLGGHDRSTPSFYELDFIADEVRYSYGFEVDDDAVRGEWLFSFPYGKPRRLFERTGPRTYDFGRSLTGPNAQIAKLTRANSLFLSSAANNDHPLLGKLHHWLTGRLHFASQNSNEEDQRLKAVRTLLNDPVVAPPLTRLLQAADLGISKVEVQKGEVSPATQEVLDVILRSASDEKSMVKVVDEIRDELRTVIRLTHHSPNGPAPLGINEESGGTKAWLALTGHLMLAMFRPSVLLVDEVDSSLHPHLSSTVIRMFKDPDINTLGSQLVFASHDTTLLGSMLDDKILDRDEVWFTEKDEEGATSLYSLAEFGPRRDENIERGYLQGRYGAVPYLSFDEIRKIFKELRAEQDESSAQPSTPPAEDRDPQAEEAATHRL